MSKSLYLRASLRRRRNPREHVGLHPLDKVRAVRRLAVKLLVPGARGAGFLGGCSGIDGGKRSVVAVIYLGWLVLWLGSWWVGRFVGLLVC